MGKPAAFAILLALAAPALGFFEEVPLVPDPVDAPLFNKELWDGLAPIDPGLASWLVSRVPGIDAGQARELPGAQAERLLEQAVARGYSGSDVFTDRGLRAPRLFFLREADVQRLFDRYEMRFLSLPSGETTRGERYVLQGLLLGADRVVCLYSLSEFEFRNPYFPSRKFKFREPVIYTIRGPADLGMQGAEVNWNLVWPNINRFVRIAPNKVRVETSLGSAEESLEPIRRK